MGALRDLAREMTEKWRRNKLKRGQASKLVSEGSETDNVGTSSQTGTSLALSNNEHLGGGEGDVLSSEREMPQTDRPETRQSPSIYITNGSEEVLKAVQQRQTNRLSTGSAGFLTSPISLPQNRTGISVARTEVVYTTRCDNGAEYAAEYISQQVIDDLTPPEEVDSSVPYVERIKELLAQAEVESDWQGIFIPCTKLVAIINQTCVERILKDVVDITTPEGAEIVAQICGTSLETSGPFRKVFATLIRIGKHESIIDFIKHKPAINDLVLPLHMVRTPDGQRCGLALRSSRSTPIAFTAGKQWTIDQRQGFFDQQWRLYPTFFAVEGDKDDDTHKKVHYECPSGTVLPFVHQQTPSSTWNHQGPTNSRRKPKEGGNSIVSFHKLHVNQQNLKRYTTQGPERQVAVKKLKTSSCDEFHKELKILIKLTPLETPHLAKLLATFETQDKSTTERAFCFMSESADSNLHEFWEQDPTSLDLTPTQVARWVAEQCYGLAEGMHQIHNYQYKDDPERHGFHGDVKPANILVFRNWIGHEHPLGILQITDFGISSFHHTASLSGISRGRDYHPYRPPESNLPFMKTIQSHDIWTLGCLFLEFMTWLIKGPAAIEEFDNNRRSYGFSSNVAVSTFYQVDEKDGRTVISISEDVLAWANHLCEDRSASRFVCDFIELITRKMLVIEDTGIKASANRMNSSSQSPQNLVAIATTDISTPAASKTSNWVPTKRISAAYLVSELEKMKLSGDEYFTNPVDEKEKPRFHHNDGTRQVITFRMSLEKIANVATEQVRRRQEEKEAARQTGKAAVDKLDALPESGYVTDASRQDVEAGENMITDGSRQPSSD